ncbi:hypothetical protein [Sphingobium fluviale]|uniref:Uncharacterized protein n=1 Tax=Sphingobium fluviale TaxID=2506423 RepID=A0A4V1N3K3_9SPHN|nr:hypothetical protein [Sphingobium fluviale]RXR28966.1 hypothetical protein EQG66_07765 [Sphingobium fluviale]
MSGNIFYPLGAGGASQPGNPNHSYELDDLVADAIAVTSGGGAHVLGSYVSLGDIDTACSGLILHVGGVGTATMRCQWSLRKNGSTIILPDLHINPGTNSWNRIPLPLALAAGDTVEVALRCQAASQAMRAAMVPFDANAQAAPGFAACTGVNVSSGGTYPHASPVGNAGTWVEITSSSGLPADIGAFIVSACNDSVPATAQRSRLAIGIGAPGSEVEIYPDMLNVITLSPYLASAISPVVRKALPAGTRVHAKITAPAPNSDTARVGLWTFA